MREGWYRFTSQAEAHKAAEAMRADFVGRIEWTDSGWYWLVVRKERCPRGCCWDTFAYVIPAQDRAEQIRQEMLELADQLRQARLYASESRN